MTNWTSHAPLYRCQQLHSSVVLLESTYVVSERAYKPPKKTGSSAFMMMTTTPASLKFENKVPETSTESLYLGKI